MKKVIIVILAIPSKLISDNNMKSKINIFFSLLILFFIFIQDSFSQPHTEWVQRFNSPENYNVYVSDMAVDNSGNVYLTGYVSVNDTNQNYVTIKYDPQGEQKWVRYYDGPDHREDKPTAIAVDDSGNVIVSGSSYSNNSSYDFLTIKYNFNGDSLWTRRYTSGLLVRAMKLDNLGNIIVTGTNIIGDIITTKYSYFGLQEWSKIFNGKGNGYDDPHSISVDFNNNIYINGFSFKSSGSVTLKYDPKGNEIWNRYFFASWYYIDVDTTGNIYCGGVTLGNGIDYCVLKYNSLGDTIWSRKYDSGNITNNNDDSREMYVDKQGNVTITGVNSPDLHDFDIATVKYNTDGETIWSHKYIGINSSNEDSKGVIGDKFGNIYIGGVTNDAQLSLKYLIIKYNFSGNQQWVEKYDNNPQTSHSIRKIKIDSSGSIYITGIATGYGISQDILTIKYSTMTEYNNPIHLIPIDFKLYQNYPNPFNPKTTINYDLPVLSTVSLKVFNIIGKEIYTLVNEKQNAGKYDYVFDGSDLTSGIYFYTLSANGLIISTKKLILLK